MGFIRFFERGVVRLIFFLLIDEKWRGLRLRFGKK